MSDAPREETIWAGEPRPRYHHAHPADGWTYSPIELEGLWSIPFDEGLLIADREKNFQFHEAMAVRKNLAEDKVAADAIFNDTLKQVDDPMPPGIHADCSLDCDDVSHRYDVKQALDRARGTEITEYTLDGNVTTAKSWFWTEMKVFQGGLMRCCLDTIQNRLPKDAAFAEGEIIDCAHERPGNARIIVTKGVFLWNSANKPSGI